MKRLLNKIAVSCHILLISTYGAFAQNNAEIDLTVAYEMAEADYPLSGHRLLLEKESYLNREIIHKGKLPVVSANAEGRVQTENVAFISGDPSGLNFEVPLESYRVYLGLDYQLYDGGMAAAQRQVETASLNVNQWSLEVSLCSLKERVNQLFFNILLARRQQSLLQTSIDDINANMEILEAGYDNGVILMSEVAKLRVRSIELSSELARLSGTERAYLSVLSELVGQALPSDVILSLPDTEPTIPPISEGIDRPELDLYDASAQLLNAQEGLIAAARKPKVSLYAQGGVGYPNPLNFTDINSSSYALGGVRMGWQISDWGKSKYEKEKLRIQEARNLLSKATFEDDISARRGEFDEKIRSLNQQLNNDLEIIKLQQQILEQSEAQLANGVINTNDYLLQVNAELAARQQYELHHMQLKQLHIDYLTLTGRL